MVEFFTWHSYSASSLSVAFKICRLNTPLSSVPKKVNYNLNYKIAMLLKMRVSRRQEGVRSHTVSSQSASLMLLNSDKKGLQVMESLQETTTGFNVQK